MPYKDPKKEYHKKYYQENKERKKEYDKKYRQENKEEIKEHHKKYYQENKEEIKEYSKKYRQENKEKYQEYSKKYRQENKERKKEYHKKYYQENRDILIKKKKEYHKNNPEVNLKYKMKALAILGKEFKLLSWDYKYALISWTKSVRKILGEYCSICGSKDGLNSHHIFPKAIHPKLSLNINNGIPLCKEHHQEVHRLNPIRRQSIAA